MIGIPHRVAIANGRITEFDEGHVTFLWRDSRDGNKQKLMTLEAVEFIRRYLLHVLPCADRARAAPRCRSFLLFITRTLDDEARRNIIFLGVGSRCVQQRCVDFRQVGPQAAKYEIAL